MNEMNESDTLECCFNNFEPLLKQTEWVELNPPIMT